MQKDIRHTWFFEHAPEKVWEYITDAALVAQWLMPNDMLPVVGHKFTFTTKPLPHMNFDGIAHCEILIATPPKLFAYSWKGGPGNGEISLDSVVTWELTPKENGTELVLLHSGFTDENEIIFTAMNEGWGKHIKTRLFDLINAK